MTSLTNLVAIEIVAIAVTALAVWLALRFMADVSILRFIKDIWNGMAKPLKDIQNSAKERSNQTKTWWRGQFRSKTPNENSSDPILNEQKPPATDAIPSKETTAGQQAVTATHEVKQND